MDFKVIEEDGVYWVYMAQDGVHSRAVVDTVMDIWVIPIASNIISYLLSGNN